ncbi:SDR family oxidoreductase [Erwinia sp. HDF1-3R]|uniref:SDR family oxidoreductase n=1 Tax=Erwinia TaxID=551 RepID=UPI0031F4C860
MSKNILITGAGTGFGKEVAFRLAASGFNVIAAVEIEAQVFTLKQEAAKKNVTLRVEKLDISDADDRLAASRWDIDILLNNAGISEGGAVVDIPEENLRKQFEVNVFGTILLTQLFARKFVARKSGRIIFMSSVAGITTDPFAGAYSASKHALEAFAEALNKELKEFNVNVATINPGPILTGFNDRMFETWQRWKKDEPAVFDYAKIAFPHEQYDPEHVYALTVKVVKEEITRYRNVVPTELEEGTKQQMDAVWSRQQHTDSKRSEEVETAYQMSPETPNGK